MSVFVSSIQFRHGIWQFHPKTVVLSPHIRFSQKFDLHTLTQHFYFFSQTRVDEAYKRNSQKIQPVNLKLSNGSKPDGSDAYKLNSIKKEIPIHDLTNRYTH